MQTNSNEKTQSLNPFNWIQNKLYQFRNITKRESKSQDTEQRHICNNQNTKSKVRSNGIIQTVKQITLRSINIFRNGPLKVPPISMHLEEETSSINAVHTIEDQMESMQIIIDKNQEKSNWMMNYLRIQ